MAGNEWNNPQDPRPSVMALVQASIAADEAQKAAAGEAPTNTKYERKLVSLRFVSKVTPIKRAPYDILEIDGWTVAVRRDDNHKVGHLVLYFEIDSFVPAGGRFWELRNEYVEFGGKQGYHVKSRRVHHKVSQGMVWRYQAFYEINKIVEDLKFKVGEVEGIKQAMAMSFEKMLGVVKWEADPHGDGYYLATPPGFFPLPGCPRIQSAPHQFAGDNVDKIVYQVTEKLDGFPMVAFHVTNESRWIQGLPKLSDEGNTKAMTPTGRFAVCDHTGELDPMKAGPYWQVVEQLDLVNKISQIGIPNVAVSGELCNAAMWGNNGYAEDEHRFYVFGMYNIDKQQRVDHKQVEAICKRLGLPHVPIIGYMTLRQMGVSNMEELLLKADGVGFRGQTREGFMLKTVRGSGSWKVISNKWLLERGM